MRFSIRHTLSILILAAALPAFGVARLGLQAGLSSSNLSGSTVTYDSRSGLLVGALLELGAGEGLSIQPEVNYVQRGARVNSGGTTLFEFNYNYIQVPAYVKYTLDLPLLKPFIGIGPYLAFKSKAELNGSEITNAPSTDFGFSGMLGVELAFTPFTSVFAQMRYDMGMTNLDTSGATTVRNRTFAFLGGLTFGF